MKAIKKSINKKQKAWNYGDRIAADECRAELRRYARDKESFAYTAMDFIASMFERFQDHETALMVKNCKGLYLAADKTIGADGKFLDVDTSEKEKNVKRALDAAIKTLWMTDYPGTALTLENEAARHFGELDEHRDKKKPYKHHQIQYVPMEEEG